MADKLEPNYTNLTEALRLSRDALYEIRKYSIGAIDESKTQRSLESIVDEIQMYLREFRNYVDQEATEIVKEGMKRGR